MNKQITSVFYDANLLPFKDSERSVHYPLVSGTFAGSHNTKEVRFYVRDIGGTNGISWVVVSKLPNGKIGYEVCSNVQTDSELGEQYLSFDLSAYYTQVKGDLYLALRGYQGQIEFTDLDEDGNKLAGNVYRIVGDPLIEVTGTIKLSINYSPMVNTGTQVLPTEIDQLIAALSNYLLIENGIILTNDKSELSLNDLAVGKVVFEYKETSGYYQGRFYGVGEEQGTKYWEKLRFSQLDTQDINIYGSTKVWGELRITNNSRIIYGDNQLKFIVNGHTFALSTSGVVTIDDERLVSEDYGDSRYIRKNYSVTRANTLADLHTLMGNSNVGVVYFEGQYLFGKIRTTGSNVYGFEFEDIGTKSRYIGNNVSGSTGIGDVFSTIGSYYKPYATEEYVDSAITDFLQNEYSKVNTTTYPTLDDFLASTGEEGYIYLYPIDTSDESKGYYQYIWENNAWVSLGTTQIDLSGYVEKTTTIAGIDLQDNIGASELANAINDDLNLTNTTTDVAYILGD